MTIKYTRDDVREFARVVFRGWKELYKAQNNPADANKQRKRKKKIVRSQRSKQVCFLLTSSCPLSRLSQAVLIIISQLKQDRLKQVGAYIEKFGADPTPLLETDWMSEFFSGLDTDDETKKLVHQARVQTAARLTEDQKKKGVKVWEKVTKLFRSDEVSKLVSIKFKSMTHGFFCKLNKVYKDLDDLHDESRAKSDKTHISIQRVFLERVDINPPESSVFPFMISEGWFEDHIYGSSLEAALTKYEADPLGFGLRKEWH